MVPARSRSRLAKRFLLTAVATFVAAGAMAYSNGSGHQDEAPPSQTAGNGPSYGGYSQIETQQSSDGGSAGGGSQGAGGASNSRSRISQAVRGATTGRATVTTARCRAALS